MDTQLQYANMPKLEAAPALNSSKMFSYTGEVPDQKIKLDWKTLKEPVMPRTISACQIRPDSLTVDCARADAYKALITADKAAMMIKALLFGLI